MPRAKKTTSSKKFDPREASTTEETNKTPEMTTSSISPEALSLITSLSEQVKTLGEQVKILSTGQKQIGDDVEKYRQETATEKAASLKKVEQSRKSKREIMKEKWAKQPRVNMFVPFEGGEKKGARLWVEANGYVYEHTDGLAGIPKGVYVSVPKGVFDIASESLNQQIENIGFENRIDLKETAADGGKFDPEKLSR